MCATFTEDDVGKAVEGPDGTAIGVVASIEGDSALVDPKPGAVDSIEATLGWESDDESTVPVATDAVAEITDDAIRLESDRGSGDEQLDGGHDSVVAQDDDTGGQRGVGATNDGGELAERDQPQVEGEAGGDRHEDNEEAPPRGDRTVTTDRGRKDDR